MGPNPGNGAAKAVLSPGSGTEDTESKTEALRLTRTLLLNHPNIFERDSN